MVKAFGFEIVTQRTCADTRALEGTLTERGDSRRDSCDQSKL